MKAWTKSPRLQSLTLTKTEPEVAVYGTLFTYKGHIVLNCGKGKSMRYTLTPPFCRLGRQNDIDISYQQFLCPVTRVGKITFTWLAIQKLAAGAF